jgi:hypothetical protein
MILEAIFILSSAAGAYFGALTYRLWKNRDQVEQNSQRVAPDSTLLQRLSGEGYRPMGDKDWRVRKTFCIEELPNGKYKWRSGYTLSDEAIKSTLIKQDLKL